MASETMVRLEHELYLPDERVENPGAAIDALIEAFAGNEAMLARLKALKAQGEQAQAEWLLSQPDRGMSRSAGCFMAIVVITVLVIVGYEYYKVYNAHLKRMEERRRPIYEERQEEREKEVCPDEQDPDQQ